MAASTVRVRGNPSRPISGKHLFTIEHEIRSLTHPMCLRPLINRNPAQTARNYAQGHDQVIWAMEPQVYV